MALHSFPIHRPAITVVSYWTSPATCFGADEIICEGVHIRHTPGVDTAYLSSCQTQGRNGVMPSSCVWMVPPVPGSRDFDV